MFPFLIQIAIWDLIVALATRLFAFVRLPAIIGAITLALTNFFTTRGLSILFGMGIGTMYFFGMNTIIEYMKNDLLLITNSVGSASGTGVSSIAHYAIQSLASIGFFEGIEIITSGYLTMFSLVQVKFVLKRITN